MTSYVFYDFSLLPRLLALLTPHASDYIYIIYIYIYIYARWPYLSKRHHAHGGNDARSSSENRAAPRPCPAVFPPRAAGAQPALNRCTLSPPPTTTPWQGAWCTAAPAFPPCMPICGKTRVPRGLEAVGTGAAADTHCSGHGHGISLRPMNAGNQEMASRG